MHGTDDTPSLHNEPPQSVATSSRRYLPEDPAQEENEGPLVALNSFARSRSQSSAIAHCISPFEMIAEANNGTCGIQVRVNTPKFIV